MAPLTLENMSAMISEITTQAQRDSFEQKQEIDFAYGVANVGRFRVNLFHQRGTPAMAIRAIRVHIPAFDELHFPASVLGIAKSERGLVLVTGTTGSGKSTLLASMIDHVNEQSALNIVTVEDPIEFLFRDKRSIIAQRELGADTPSFTAALRGCFRQDPDVILIGEIRDKETMETALSAADTGHLVMSTLHTMNCVETISRIVNFFPQHEHQQVRLVLSNVLVAVISLRLVQKIDSQGRVPASEIMVNTAAIAEYIRDPEKAHLIMPAVADGFSTYGSHTFDQSLLHLYQEGLVDYEVARLNANNPEDFALKVRGIAGTSDRKWMISHTPGTPM
jgi:twitching motility protein PilT